MGQEPEGFKDALGLLDAWTANRVASRGQPGLSIGVVLGDHLVWARGYGFADLEHKTRATPKTLYRIGSITKTFTAISVLQLRDAGKLQLDDPLQRHLSQVNIRPHSNNASAVTLRELLTHTSGLQRNVPGTIVTDTIWPSDADLQAATLDQPFDPDTHWKYSNLGFALLGKVVTAESGQPWDKYVQDHILLPLGMLATHPVPRPDEPGLAVGYLRAAPGTNFVPAPFFHSGSTAPAGAIASNVEDLAKYMAFHIDEGSNGDSRVLSGRSLREMHRVQWLLPDWQNGWGLGMHVRRVDGMVGVGHSGNVPGHTANMEFIPALKLGVIVCTNSNEGDPTAYVAYALQLLSPIIAKSMVRPSPTPDEQWRRYEGIYRSKDYQTWIVTILDGQLSMVAPGTPSPSTGRMILEGTHDRTMFTMRAAAGFSYAGGDGEKLTFDVSADGTVTGFHTEDWRFSRAGGLEAP
jgi:CubicO group peptidase (beta-lactamase class C family)